MSADVGLGWASLGLQTISTIGAASGQARANRATIKGNNKAIKLLDENLSLLPEIAQSRKEGAMSDLNLAMGQAGYEGRESSITAFQDYENALGSTGFAADYSMQDAYGDFQRKLNDNFMQQRKSLFSSLDKNLADIAEWQMSTEGQLKSQKMKLEAQNAQLRTQDSFWENIF